MIPKISVLMTTYDDGVFLRPAIESILRQTFSEFELIIIDDAATEIASEIVKYYEGVDNRIKVVRNEKNIGLTRSLNVGLGECRASYVARMDGDDISHVRRLEWQYNYFLNNPDCSVLATDGLVIDEAGRRLKRKTVDFKGLNQEEYLMRYPSPFIHTSMMYIKNVIMESGGYNEEFLTSQDLELWLRLLERGAKIHVLHKALVCFRLRSGSASYLDARGLRTNIVIRLLHTARKYDIDVTRQKVEEVVAKDVWSRRYAKRVIAQKTFLLGLGYLKAREYVKAIDAFSTCISQFPDAAKRIETLSIVDNLLGKILQERQEEVDSHLNN